MNGQQCEPHTGTVGSYSPADEDAIGGVNDDDNEDVNDGDNNGTEMVLFPLCIKHYTQCDKELRIKHNFLQFIQFFIYLALMFVLIHLL